MEDQLGVALLVLGLLVLVTGAVSKPLRRTVGTPVVALALGVALGPVGLDVVRIERWGDPWHVLEILAEVTLAIAVMAVALRIPRVYVLEEARPLAVVLLLLMPLMWIASSAVVAWALGVPLLLALLLGAMLTPTDPVVASAVVTGEFAEKRIPARLRHLISAESGANDGLAHVLVVAPVLVLLHGAGGATGGVARAFLWEIGGALVLGAALGAGAATLLHWAERRDTIGEHSFIAHTLALSLLVFGLARLVGVTSVLAVFAAGLAFDLIANSRERAEEEKVQEAVNHFFTFPIFALVGVVLPWSAWGTLGWSALGLALGILLLRRLPGTLLLAPLVAPLRTRRETLFVGWFGPIGISAVYYAARSVRETGDTSLWVPVSLVVVASLLVHGLTAPPLTRWLGRNEAEPT